MIKLENVVTRFMHCFNSADLEGAMACLAEDAVYSDEFATEHRGHAALRASLGPILDGSYGQLQYIIEDTLYDEVKQRALVVWTLEIDAQDGAKSRMKGLDIIHVKDDQVTLKNCYMKSKEALIETVE